MSSAVRSLRGAYEVHGEKLRFLLVGVWNTAFSYALFLLLLATVGPAVQSLSSSEMGALGLVGRNYYLVVQWLTWVVAVPQSTLSMKYFAFRQPGRLLPQIGRAYFIYLPAQGLSSLILWLGVRVAGLAPAVGALVAIVVTTIFSYLGHKYFTFRAPLAVGEVIDPTLLNTDASGVLLQPRMPDV